MKKPIRLCTIGAILAIPLAAATTAEVLASVGTVIDVIVAVLVVMVIYYTIKLAFMSDATGTIFEQAEQQGWFAQLLANKAKNWIANTLETSGADDASRAFKSLTGIYSLDDLKKDIEKSKDALTGVLNLMCETLNEMADENKIKAWLNSIKTNSSDTASPWNDTTLDTKTLVELFNKYVIMTAAAHTGYSFDKNSIKKVCKKIVELTANLEALKTKETAKKNKSAAINDINAVIKKITELGRHANELVQHYFDVNKGILTSGTVIVGECIKFKDKIAKMNEDKRAEEITKTLGLYLKKLINNLKEAEKIIEKLD